MADRARYETGITANPKTPDRYRESLDRGFDEFALSRETDCLYQDRIEADSAVLHIAAETTRAHTNKIIAYREVVTEKITLAWADLDRALNTVRSTRLRPAEM